MDPHGMSMPPQSMGMYAQPPQMQLNQVPSADWRIQLTREHRANLIAKIYNEMVRVSGDPVPGIKLWMNVSWYELSLYKESPTQEVYINKIFTRLKSLRAQQSDMAAAMAAQALPNQGMLSRLDFSYYNTLNLGQRGSYPGQSQFGGPGPHPGAQQQQQQGKPVTQQVKTEPQTNSVDEYWRQHAALRAKHQGDVEKVHSAFKKYVDHMKGHDETEQKKKLRYLLSYVELCANILSEDKATHPPRKIEELDKVFKYIVKIVNPYLKKLRTETDKRSYPTDSNGQADGSGAPTSTGATTSSGASTELAGTSSGFTSAMTQPQPAGQTQQTPQQKQQQQYIMQQRAQQMHQQQHQRMQVQARQQQMMQQQQQQMMQQQQMQKGPQQSQYSQQANPTNQQQNSQNAANQQSGQQTQQQMGQQGPARPQQTAAQPEKPQQSQHKQLNPQAPVSRGESPTITAGLSLDESLYGSMSSDLLQMPTPSGTSSGLMDFSSALSPTSFGGMDLLDWDDSISAPGVSGQGNTNTSGGDSADLVTFVETL